MFVVHEFHRQAKRILNTLLRYDPAQAAEPGAPGYGAGSGAPGVMFGFLKHMWATAGAVPDPFARKVDAIRRLQARIRRDWACSSLACVSACLGALDLFARNAGVVK